MSKEIKINGEKYLYDVIVTSVTKGTKSNYTCTIEHVRNDEYYAYCDEGEGACVAELDTVDIVELITTGSVEQEYLSVTIK